MRNPNLCPLLCCPVPCQDDGTPVLCISALAASPYVRVFFSFSDVCFIFMIIGFIFAPPFLPSLGFLCRPCPTSWTKKCLVCVRALCRCSFFCFFCFLFFFPAFRLVWSCRPPLGPSPRHIIGLIVPANSNRVPSGLGRRHARMHKVFVSVFFPFCSFLFFLLLPFFALLCIPVLSCPLFGCTYVPQLCSVRKTMTSNTE